VGLDTYLDELLLSHSLFFGRSKKPDYTTATSTTPKLRGVNTTLIEDYQKYWSEDISAVHITDFPIYGHRLQTIHQRMTDWRSLEFWHSWNHRPYRDSLPFYAFRFALILGVLSMVTFILAITTLGLNIRWHKDGGESGSPPAPTSTRSLFYQGQLKEEY
jgi:hypothetical protein